MSWAIAAKLVAILVAVAIGWVVGRMRWLGGGPAGSDTDPARVLANAAFFIFVPALLFRTTARLDTATLPWAFLLAFFVPALALIAVVLLVLVNGFFVAAEFALVRVRRARLEELAALLEARARVLPAAELVRCRPGQLARASGLVTHRQRPETAKGVVFVSLEDETGGVNVIVWPQVAQAQRQPLLSARLLTVYGVWQQEAGVGHLIARRLVDHSELLQGLNTRSRDFR